MFWSCLSCVAACLRVCMCAVGTSAWRSVWWGCVWLSLCGCWTVSPCRGVAVLRCRGVAEEARRRFTCRLRRATVLLFGRVIDTS